MTTRAVLFQAVQDYMRRSDSAFVAALPTMLLNVESRINDEIIHSTQTTVTTLALSGRTVALPTDCVEIRSLTVQDGDTLDWVTPEVLREGSLWDGAGCPSQYTIENRDIYVAPAASATLDLSYYARYTAMANDSDTTGLLTQNFNLYLYAMLAEAARFVQDEEMERRYEMAFVDIRRQVQQKDTDYQTSGSVMRRISQRQDLV